MDLDARELRDALSSFGTGVTIVTACDEAGMPVGMTASSFNSVSMDPPLILWSVTKTARSAAVFKEAGSFCVHVLGTHQIETSNKFARQGEDKFEAVEYAINADGVPVLDDFSARFDCKTWSIYEGGDHWIIVGEVKKFERKKAEGLLFAGGSYATSSPIQQNKPTPKEKDGPVAHIENMLVYQLSRAHQQLTSEFRGILSKNNLSTPEWRILASIDGVGVQRTFEDLSKRTFIRMDALRDLVHSMQDQGLCDCTKLDGAVVVRGTEKGFEIVGKLFDLAQMHEESALKGLSDQQIADLSETLRIIVKNTNQ